MKSPTLVLSFVCVLGTLLPAQEVPSQDKDKTSLDAKQIASQLVEAQTRLANLPKDAATNSTGALLRKALERRTQILGDAAKLLARARAQDAIPEEMKERRHKLEKLRSDEAKLPALVAPLSPTNAGLAELEAKVGAQRDRLTSMRSQESERTLYVEKIPALVAEAAERLEAAVENGNRLAQERSAATQPGEKEVSDTRVENAALDVELVRLAIQVMERDRAQEQSLAPLRQEERELAERHLERMEQQYTLYSRALGQEIDREVIRLDAQLEKLEAAVQNAPGPAAKFLAGKRLGIARFEKNTITTGRFLLALGADREEQQRHSTAETDELKGLREYFEKAGDGAQAGDRMKFTMQRVKLRRQLLKRTLRRDIAGELASYRSRRFELEDEMFTLKDVWNQEVESVAGQLTGPEVASFRAAAAETYEPYRTALRGERDVLANVIDAGQELQIALIKRRDALAELDGFIRSKVFWIRDAKPLGPGIWPRLEAESAVVAAWGREIASDDTRARIAANFTRGGVLLTTLALLLILPIGLFWARQRLRRVVTRLNDRTLGDDAKISDRILAVTVSILSVALLPVYLLIASRATRVADLPESLAPVLASLLEYVAIFVFFMFLSRSFFAGRGTAQVQFGMDRDAAHTLHRALRLALLGYLIFFFPGAALASPPFVLESRALEALPRIAYTLFLLLAVVAGGILLQPRSGFSHYWASALGDNFVGRRWPIFGTLICVTGVGILVLDIAGYRYGAGVLARNLIVSLGVFLLLVPSYKGVVFAIESVARRRRENRLQEDIDDPESYGAGSADDGPATGVPDDAKREVPQTESGDLADASGEVVQLRKFLRVIFVLAGVVLVAGLWGIDQQTFRILEEPIYGIRGTDPEESVKVGDLLQTLAYLIGTYFLLKNLPGIYEYAIFPRFKFDAGLKYAILTMSRYGIFTLGVILALSALHLDLGRLQWLMAAIGVGLGFGLQEIVSNFVSGIILLVERPVRVGDVVTIGTISGKVQRINIRATTVINFDRQEIIVPNRSLITKEVTNWTRGDTIIRLVVPIGVAYGSDVDQVTDLLLEIAREQPEILENPGPNAFFLSHGESSLDFELRVFVPDPSVKTPLLHRLNRTINRRLTELGIEIPFPQRDLHIRSSAVPWPMEPEAEERRPVQTS